MKVLHVLKINNIAGAERHLLMLLSQQRARGLDARFLLLVQPDKPMDDFAALADARGIPVSRIVIRSHADISVYPRLWRQMRAFKPDIVHTHLQHGDLFGIPAARLAGVRTVISSRHNADVRRRKRALQLLNAALWRLSSGGIAISEYIRQFSIEVENAPPARTFTVHYGLENPQRYDRAAARTVLVEAAGLPQDAVIAGMVCRLIPVKGIDTALQALAQVKDEFPQAHLVIIGDGPLRETLEAAVQTLGLAGRAHLVGWRSDAAQLMAGFDLLLVTSLSEGFGLVMLEAMAQGVPVIASDAGAMPEIVIPGETGRLFPVQDADALADAQRALLADPAQRAAMGAAGETRLHAHFTAESMADATLAVYERLRH